MHCVLFREDFHIENEIVRRLLIIIGDMFSIRLWCYLRHQHHRVHIEWVHVQLQRQHIPQHFLVHFNFHRTQVQPQHFQGLLCSLSSSLATAGTFSTGAASFSAKRAIPPLGAGEATERDRAEARMAIRNKVFRAILNRRRLLCLVLCVASIPKASTGLCHFILF